MNIELTPRRTLTPDELKRLGTALQEWFVMFLQQRPDIDGWKDDEALADVLSGELPSPFLLRCLRDPPRLNIGEMQAALEKARAQHPMLDRMLPPFHGRCVPFGFTLADDDQDEVLTSLRCGVPMELVRSIRINGKEQPI